MIETNDIYNSKITHLFFEWIGTDYTEDFSGKTFEIIIGLKKLNTTRFLRFIADNNIVEIKEETLPKLKENSVSKLIDLSSDKSFAQYVGKTISKIEVEGYPDNEVNGYHITLENDLQIEVYTNSYGTSGYFKDVKKYSQKKIKYLAEQTHYKNL